jgi:hypothetical protein
LQEGLAILRPGQDLLQIPEQPHIMLAAPLGRRDDDLLDQRPQRRRRLSAVIGVSERFGQPLDLAAV